MSRKLFVNLPVRDLKQSMVFFRQLGFDFNEQFSDDTAACLVISEANYAMLLTHDKFRQFTSKTICDSRETTEVLVALSCESRAEVDELCDKALAAGGKPARPPKDHGFMYERAIDDLDGHTWEFFWMDEAAIPQQ